MKPLAANLEKQVLGLQMGHESTTTIENAAKHLYTVNIKENIIITKASNNRLEIDANSLLYSS